MSNPGENDLVTLERDDLLGIARFRLGVVTSGVPASFVIGMKEYRLNEYGNYIDHVFPDADTEFHRLTGAIIEAQSKRRRATGRDKG